MKIITLCGSTRFKKLFNYWNKELTMRGNIVFSVGVFNSYKLSENDIDESCEFIKKEKDNLLDVIHKKKIDMSDVIFVINKNGYIGNSTKSEIDYAEKLGKEIIFLEDKK